MKIQQPREQHMRDHGNHKRRRSAARQWFFPKQRNDARGLHSQANSPSLALQSVVYSRGDTLKADAFTNRVAIWRPTVGLVNRCKMAHIPGEACLPVYTRARRWIHMFTLDSNTS